MSRETNKRRKLARDSKLKSDCLLDQKIHERKAKKIIKKYKKSTDDPEFIEMTELMGELIGKVNYCKINIIQPILFVKI